MMHRLMIRCINAHNNIFSTNNQVRFKTGREGNYFQSERCTDEDDRKESRYKKPIRHVRPRNRLTVYEQKIRKGKKKAAG